VGRKTPRVLESIQQGKPTQNTYAERFNGRLRDDI
jgi:hypothetical protein